MFFLIRVMKNLLEQTWLVFLAAIVIALIYPDISSILEPYLTFILILLMAFSARNVNLKDLLDKKIIKNAFVMSLFNYLILSSVIILVGLFVDPKYFPGFVLMAAVPTAISVIPYTQLLRGSKHASTAGLIVTYLVSLIFTPLIIYAFFGKGIDIKELVEKIIMLVFVPLILGPALKKIDHKVKEHEKKITNIIFFILTYSFIGLNQSTIVNKFFSLKLVLLALFLRTFVLSSVVYFLTKKYGKLGISYTLFASFKNLGYATILALALFGKEASLPTTIGMIFETLTFIILERLTAINEVHTLR